VLILDPRSPSVSSSSAEPSASGSASRDDGFPPGLRSALRDREEGALAAFYDAYFDRVYAYVRRMVGSQHLAEDLTQDIFMHLLSNLESYDPARPLRPWVFTIATNKLRDFWRSRRHRMGQREVSIEADEGGGWTTSDEPRPEERLMAVERTGKLAEAIEALPESMRVTLMLRYYEGMSFADIGAIVERNEDAVRKRYSRALEELRKALTPPEEGGEA